MFYCSRPQSLQMEFILTRYGTETLEIDQVRQALPERAEQTASAGRQLVGGSLPIGGRPRWTQCRTWGASTPPGWRQQPSGLHRTTYSARRSAITLGWPRAQEAGMTSLAPRPSTPSSTRTRMKRRSFLPPAHLPGV